MQRVLLSKILVVAFFVGAMGNSAERTALDFIEKGLESVQREGTWRSLAMPGIPQQIRLGPVDSEHVSYVDTFGYRLIEVKGSQCQKVVERLNRLKSTAIFNPRRIRSWRLGGEISRGSFVRAVPLDKYGTQGHIFYFEDTISINEKRRLIFPDPLWENIASLYNGGQLWLEFGIDISSSGVPVNSASATARPIALKVGKQVFLVAEVPGKYKNHPVIARWTDSSFRIVVEQKNSEIIGKATRLQGSVKDRYLELLARRFSEPPISASVDQVVPGLITLERIGKSNLLDGQYEQSGYQIYVYESGWEIGTYIWLSVLTASHPDNKHFDPKAAQFRRYKDKVAEIRSNSERDVCSAFKGIYEQGTCVLRVKK